MNIGKLYPYKMYLYTFLLYLEQNKGIKVYKDKEPTISVNICGKLCVISVSGLTDIDLDNIVKDYFNDYIEYLNKIYRDKQAELEKLISKRDGAIYQMQSNQYRLGRIASIYQTKQDAHEHIRLAGNESHIMAENIELMGEIKQICDNGHKVWVNMQIIRYIVSGQIGKIKLTTNGNKKKPYLIAEFTSIKPQSAQQGVKQPK